ncbi:MAG: hypothetical protein A9Z00_12920 [Thermobacillus sp. ZCTH02-B1]|nr:MAG: hypothetical protein A9Z00_12920 [Thermobacillus sp. ZCTH02-B1]
MTLRRTRSAARRGMSGRCGRESFRERSGRGSSRRRGAVIVPETDRKRIVFEKRGGDRSGSDTDVRACRHDPSGSRRQVFSSHPEK